MQQTNVNATEMDDVVQGCYHHSPYSNNQSHHSVDQEEQIRQEEQTLSVNQSKTSRTGLGIAWYRILSSIVDISCIQ